MVEYEITMATSFYRDVLHIFHRDGYIQRHKVLGDQPRYCYSVEDRQIANFSATVKNLFSLGKIVGLAVVTDKKYSVRFCDQCGHAEILPLQDYIHLHSHCDTIMRNFTSLTQKDLQLAYNMNTSLLYYAPIDGFLNRGWYEVKIHSIQEEYVVVALVYEAGVHSQLPFGGSCKTKLREFP